MLVLFDVKFKRLNDALLSGSRWRVYRVMYCCRGWLVHYPYPYPGMYLCFNPRECVFSIHANPEWYAPITLVTEIHRIANDTLLLCTSAEACGTTTIKHGYVNILVSEPSFCMFMRYACFRVAPIHIQLIIWLHMFFKETLVLCNSSYQKHREILFGHVLVFSGYRTLNIVVYCIIVNN